MKTANIISYGLASFDVNGDNKPDLLWGAGDTTGLVVNVHYGGPGFSPIPNLRLKNPGVNNFGFTIANAGDMNGDGYDDIAVGARSATITSGFVFVFSGGPKIDELLDAGIGRSMDSDFGYTVSSLGDINGDGLADIIVGAPSYAFRREKGYWGVFLGDTAIHVTDVRMEDIIPRSFGLEQAYPNPFNPVTTIRYQVAREAFISIKVFDVVGRMVRQLLHEMKPVGHYQVFFDGDGLPSGAYLYHMTAETREGSVF